MSIKAIMVDVDGVLIVHPDPRGWSANLERDLGLSGETLHTAFFTPHWQDIIHGRADLYSQLEPVLATIAPAVSAQALTQYWFENDAHLNAGLMTQLAALRETSVKLHLATVQEHHRARFLWSTLGLERHFDGLHYAAELGCSKPDQRFFRAVEAKSGFAAGEIFFIDDKQENIDGARKAGWRATLWDGTRQIGDLLRDFSW